MDDLTRTTTTSTIPGWDAVNRATITRRVVGGRVFVTDTRLVLGRGDALAGLCVDGPRWATWRTSQEEPIAGYVRKDSLDEAVVVFADVATEGADG